MLDIAERIVAFAAGITIVIGTFRLAVRTFVLLAATITAPPALWSSDRAPKRRRPPTLKLGT
jgi:hypothetical protein